nr:hypothetical protein [Clostridia bacterium]
MKKLLTLIVSLCLAMCTVFALTACGSDDVNPAGKTYEFDRVEILEEVTEDEKAFIEAVAAEEMGYVQITFKADKTYAVNLITGQTVQTGTWKADGDKVILKANAQQGEEADPDQTYIYKDGKFYGNMPIPCDTTYEKFVQCRLWFKEFKANSGAGTVDFDVSGKTYGYDHVEILTTGLTAAQIQDVEDYAESMMGYAQVTFNANNTFEINLNNGYAHNPVQTGTWLIQGNSVILTPTAEQGEEPDSPQTYYYSDGDFYGGTYIPYGEEDVEFAQCRLWFVEVDAVA